MSWRKLIVTVITVVLISLALSSTLFVEAQPPRLEEGEPDGALGAINPSYRMSDSPWLQLPEELRDVPPLLPSRPPGGGEAADGDPLTMVMYDSATGTEVRIPTDHPAYRSMEPYQAYSPAFSGLLPAGMTGFESVIGPDDRSQISPTTSFPWRTVVKLYSYFGDGAVGGCSGAIIGCGSHGYHVLTAGHCIYSHDHLGWATSVTVIPGLDGTDMPYNYALSTNVRTYNGWITSGDTRHDMGFITLDRNIGDHTGWMGRTTCNPPGGCGEYTTTLNTAGYPGDKGGETMWHDADSGHSVDEFNHWYNMDTYAGQSGSPVWLYSSGERHILTAHTCGTGGCGIDGKGVNHGTRLNQAKYDDIDNIVCADPPPTDYADLIDDGQTWSGFTPTTVRPGATAFSTWSDVRNVGTAASGGFNVSYYASTNTTITTADYLIANDLVSSISPFTYGNSDWSGTFPGGVPDGLYYVGWIIDSQSDVTEFDEGNNIAYKSSYRVLVDGTAPSNPTSVSETHGAPNNTWQGMVSNPAFTWGGASDGSGSGVAGYYVYWGPSSSGTSSTWTTSASYDPPTVPSPSIYYLRVRTRDNVGNLAAWQTLFIFRYDGSAPSNPSSVWSTSHSVGAWSNDNTIAVNWSGASDGSGSGVYGYSYVWSASATTLPNTSVNTTGSSATSPPLGDSGNWYFHIRTRDNVGNWNGGAVHLGPFGIDTSAPSNPTSASETHGAPYNTWQGTVSNPAFTWSGASDSGGSGVAGYYVYWGPSASGTSGTWTTSASYDPSAVPNPSVYYLRVRARDNAGNSASSWQTLFIFRYDGSPPAGTILVNGGDTFATSTSVGLTLSASDTASGVDAMRFSNNGSSWSSWEPYATGRAWTLTPGDGTKTVYVQYQDNAGNVSGSYSDNIILDTIAPAGSILINGGSPYANSTSVALGLSASDAAGIDGMRFSNNGSSWSSWEPYTTGKAWSLLPGDGGKTVYVQFRDEANNISSAFSDGIILDTTAPAGTVLINGGASYANSTSVALGLSASDAASGVDAMRFSNNGSSWSSWEPYGTPKSWTLDSGDGTKTVYVQYQDNAGNVSGSFSDTIILDMTAPAGSIVIDGGAIYATSTSVALTLSASDAAGVDGMRFSNNGSTFGTWEPYSTSKSWTLASNDGTKTVYVQYRDNAGNVSASQSDTIIVDTTAPTGSILIDGGASYANSTSVALGLSASDAGSGVDAMRFSNDGSSWSSWEPYAASKGWTLSPGDGPKTVYVQYQDNVGSISASYTDDIILDTTAPTSSATSPPSTTSLSFTVSWSGSDGLSGIDTFDVQYRVGSGGAWTDWLVGTSSTSDTFGPASPVGVVVDQTYYFRARARDNVGNLEAYPGGDGDSSTYVQEVFRVFLPVTLRN